MLWPGVRGWPMGVPKERIPRRGEIASLPTSDVNEVTNPRDRGQIFRPRGLISATEIHRHESSLVIRFLTQVFLWYRIKLYVHNRPVVQSNKHNVMFKRPC